MDPRRRRTRNTRTRKNPRPRPTTTSQSTNGVEPAVGWLAALNGLAVGAFDGGALATATRLDGEGVALGQAEAAGLWAKGEPQGSAEALGFGLALGAAELDGAGLGLELGRGLLLGRGEGFELGVLDGRGVELGCGVGLMLGLGVGLIVGAGVGGGVAWSGTRQVVPSVAATRSLFGPNTQPRLVMAYVPAVRCLRAKGAGGTSLPPLPSYILLLYPGPVTVIV